MSKHSFNLGAEGQIDNEALNSYKVNMTVDAIPDIDNLLSDLQEMLDFVENPRMAEYEKTNKFEFDRLLYAKFNTKLPMRVIKLITETERRYSNVDKLLNMFERLRKIKDGKKDLETESKKFGEELNEEFIYPEFGGKEKFEKEMTKPKE